MISFKVTGIERLLRTMESSRADMGLAARRGIKSGLDKWVSEAKDDALMDTGNLRKNIKPLNLIGGSGLNLTGTIVANAYNNGFNYAYYWHFYGHMPQNPTTPGTTGEFLLRSGEEFGEKITSLLEKEIQREFKKKGW